MQQQRKRALAGNLSALGMMVIFGIDAPVMKSVMPEWLNAFGLVTVRMAEAAMAALLLSLFMKKEKVSRRDKGLLFFVALFGIVLNQGGITIGVQYSSPIDVGIIVTTVPIFVLVITWFFHHEKITRWNIWGIICGLTGVMLSLFLSGTAKGSTQHNTFLGNLIVVGGMVSYGLYLSFAGNILSRYSLPTLMKWIFGFAFLIVLPFGGWELWHQPLLHQVAPVNVYLRLAFNGLGATFCAFMLNFVAMKRVSGRLIAMYGYVQPVITAIIAVLIGQARLTFVNVISAILIGTGVYLATLAKSKKA